MDNLQLYISNSSNVYRNIAIECCLHKYYSFCPTLYLWSNDNTVVIGKHQLANLECNIAELFNNQGLLARRLSGGGAVYHDKHNLCFSFICNKNIFNISQNYDIIIKALRLFGIESSLSGRNDLESSGRKFSGNAFYTKDGAIVHHGTLLIDTDIALMQKLLLVNKRKLVGHGVDSVISRVVNLKELNSSITKLDLINAIISISQVDKAKQIEFNQEQNDYITQQIEFLSSSQWLYGFDNYVSQAEGSFSWGNAKVFYTVEKGKIANIKITTDSLFVEQISEAEQFLVGVNPLTYQVDGSLFEQNKLTIINDVINLINK
ncbi:MAG: lipoate--protein ligase [Clostridia bacterium]